MNEAGLLTRPLLFCALSNLFQGIAFSLFLHVPGFYREMGAGPVAIGWLFSVMSISAIGIRPLIGSLIDSSGRRRLILAGHILNVIVIGLYFSVTEIGAWAFGVRVLHGISEATLFTVLFTYAADQIPPARLTQGLALFGVSGMAPMSLAGFLGDWILLEGEYSLLFGCAFGFAVAGLWAAWPLRDAPRVAPEIEDKSTTGGFVEVLGQRNLWPVWWLGAVFFTALAGVFIFLKTFVLDREIGSLGSYFAGYTGIAIALRLGLGWLPDRVGPTRVLVCSLVVFGLGFGWLAFAETESDVLVAGILGGIGHAYAFPILTGYVIRRARESQRGSAMAIFTGLSDLGIVAGGPLFGWILDRADYTVLYLLIAFFVVFGAVVFAVWNGRAERTSESERAGPDGKY